MAIVMTLIAIFVIAVFRCVQVCAIQHYPEYRSLDFCKNFYAAAERLAGSCAAAAHQDHAIYEL